LGIDFEPGNSHGDHPSQQDVDGVLATGAGTWLSGQLSIDDDSVGPEPEALRRFLEARQLALWQVVSVLERGVPEWAAPMSSRSGVSPRSLVLLRLDRLLLAAALASERAGSAPEVRRLLEASWSVFQTLSGDSDVISGMLATAVMTLQAGVLRKIREPPVEWLNRLSMDDPWRRALDAFENEPRAIATWNPSLTLDSRSDSFANINLRAHRAVAEPLRRVAPCALASLSAKEIGRPMEEEFRKANEPGADSNEIARIFTDMIVPTLRNSLERAGRLSVDDELTLKILELRLVRSGSRDRKWPATLEDNASRVCPGAFYEYRRDGPGLRIEFKGSPPAPEAGLRLPLSFSTRADRRPTPPAPTPTAMPAAMPAPD
jgi:hypothetical protein